MRSSIAFIEFAPHRLKRVPIVTVFCIALAAASSKSEDADLQALTTIAEVFSDNRELFGDFKCQFVVREGVSVSFEDAVAGNITVRHSRQGRWISGSGQMRYELDCPFGTDRTIPPSGKPIKGSRVPVVSTIECVPRTELWNGPLGIDVTMSKHLKVVNLATDKIAFAASVTPFSMGIMGPGETYSPLTFIMGARVNSRHCAYKGTTSINGKKVDIIETGHQFGEGKQPLATWYLDLAKGATPVRVVFTNEDGSHEGETVALSIRKLQNGAFICEKCLQTWVADEGVNTTSIELTDFTFSKPSRTELAITVEPGFHVIDVSDMRSAFRLTRRETLYADELKQWIGRCRAHRDAAVEKSERRSVATPPRSSGNYILWGIGCIIALIVVSMWLFRGAKTT